MTCRARGLGAALVMPKLQAHVRGHHARSRDDLPTLAASVNALFQQSTPVASYATLFFGAEADRWTSAMDAAPLLTEHHPGQGV